MNRLFVIAFLLLVGCGAFKPKTQQPDEMLACALQSTFEIGDMDEALACLKEAVSKEDPSPKALFLLADLLDATGNPANALPFYFETIEFAHRNGGAHHEAVAAAMAIVAIRDRVEGFVETFNSFLSRLENKPGRLPLEAWFQLQNLHLGLARKKGHMDQAALTVNRMGCLVAWQSLGPFGPWTWNDFDNTLPPGNGEPWPKTAFLGPGRGETLLRDITSDTCFVSVNDPALPIGGTTWSRTVIALNRPKTVTMRLQTNTGAIIRIGGKEVFRRDPRTNWPSRVSWFNVSLPAGATEIAVGTTTNRTTMGFSLIAVDKNGLPAFHLVDPAMVASSIPTATEHLPAGVPETNLITLYAQIKAAIWWDDTERAFELLDTLTRDIDDPTPLLLLLMAEATAQDPSLPGELAYERARALQTRALKDEPRLWQARIDLANSEFTEERIEKTIEILEKGLALCPNEPQIIWRLASVLSTEGWLAEANALVQGKLEPKFPTSCNTLAWQLTLARQSIRLDSTRKLAEQLVSCDSSSPVLAEELARSQDWQGALTERRRLFDRSPKNASLAFDVAKTALVSGDLKTAIQSTKTALHLSPLNATIRTTLADALTSIGNPKAASLVIEQGLGLPYGPRASLASALAAIEKRDLFKSLRVDGAAVIERYKTEGNDYDTAAVFVLDRAVYIVGPMGETTTIVHTVTHLKSDEAVEEHGELSLPRDAHILVARTIKSDGRILVPETITGKPTFSLPDLEPGDFIESEYITYTAPSQLFPGGFDTERFYFQNFKTAFHRSEIIVITPLNTQVVVDPRGAAPPPKEQLIGDLKIRTWQTRGTLPYPAEPLAPDATEFLPSVRIVTQASWENILSRMKDLLADKERQTRHTEEALAKATKGISSTDHLQRRKAIYYFVMNSIVPEGNLFDQASHIITRKAGNRTRAFISLLRAAGYKPRLGLVKPSGADETEPAAPQFGLYSHSTVLVPEDGWVSLIEDHAPYGYLPPELRHRPAILIDNNERVTTDGGSQPIDKQTIEMSFNLLSNGQAAGSVKESLTGILAARWRSEFERNRGIDRDKRFEETYLSSAIQGARLEHLGIENLDNPQKPLILNYQVAVPGFARMEGSALIIEAPHPLTLVKQAGGLPARATPLVLAARVNKKVTASISLPRGYTAKIATPSINPISSEWGTATSWHEVKGRVARFGYEAGLFTDRISVLEYPAFLDFARSVDRLSELKLSVIVSR